MIHALHTVVFVKKQRRHTICLDKEAATENDAFTMHGWSTDISLAKGIALEDS